MAGKWGDYSAGRPSGAALRAAGFVGVVRYVGLGRSSKLLTASEYRDLIASGVQVRFVVELGTNDAWGIETDDDFERGRQYMAAGLNHIAAIGVPKELRYVALAADAHAAAYQVDDAVRFARGGASLAGKQYAGFYGFDETARAVQADGSCGWYWLCGTTPDPSERVWTNLWQRNTAPSTASVQGITVDINDVINEFPTTGGGSTPGPSTQEVPEMTRYEVPAATGAEDDQGFVQVEPGGRADSFIRVIPGDLWIVDVAADPTNGVKEQGHFELAPVFIENLYHYGVNGEGMGNDPGEQGAIKTVAQKVETIPTPNVARTGVRYSSNAPFIIITQ